MQLPEFKNEPYSDFSKPENISAYQEAIKKVRTMLGRSYPMIIAGQEIMTDQKLSSVNPANPAEIIGYTASANAEHAEKALEAAWQAFAKWKKTPIEERVQLMLKAAELLRARKMEFNALLTLEIGKNYLEAEAETAEAIDFLEYYARLALRYAEPIKTVPLPGGGEDGFAEYIPLGAGVSISPWNFPLAIFLGQLVGPVVAGNTMVAKPAEDGAVIGAWAINLLVEAGFPAGVINFLPGKGSVVGEALVISAKTRFINFTGSKEIGLHINAEAAIVRPGQRWIKRVTLELGGKDGMIVDETADLEAAADAAVAGAFGYAGQKCSALSRLIVVEPVYQQLLDKVVEKAKKLVVGLPEENANVNPVANEDSYKKSHQYLETAKKEGKVVLGGNKLDKTGYFIEPTIVADIKPDAKLAQEEIFGPILSVIPVKDFNEAMKVVNDTDYGLTGGLFSKDEKRLEHAENNLHVGNLYLNRKITGAMVGVHPFGGFNLSGTDSKSGGPDYLALFLQMKTIARRI